MSKLENQWVMLQSVTVFHIKKLFSWQTSVTFWLFWKHIKQMLISWFVIICCNYFCVLGLPKAALDVVKNELYCFLSVVGSSSGWWPGNAIGSLAIKSEKKSKLDLQIQVHACACTLL